MKSSFCVVNGKRGFGLVISMVVLSLTSISMVAIFYSLAPLNTQFSRRYSKNYILNFISNLRNELENPYTCTLMMEDLKLGGTFEGAINKKAFIKNINTNQNEKILANWQDPNKIFKIKSLQLLTLYQKKWSQNSVISNRKIKYDKIFPILDSYQVRLIIEPLGLNIFSNISLNISELLTTNPNPKNADYSIELVVNTDPLEGNVIKSCFGPKSVAAVCEDIGGAYDTSEDLNNFPEFRCHPNYICWNDSNGIYQTSPTPSDTIDLANPPNCPWPYTHANWIGRYQNKDKWVCQWCNDEKWP